MRGQKDPHRFSVAEAVELWRAYTNWQRGQLAQSTIANDYRRTASQLSKIPKSINLSTQLIDWALTNWSPEVTRRLQQQLNACYAWAVDSRRTKANPFADLPKIAPVKTQRRYKAFTPADRAKIIEAFKVSAPQYLDWVEFLFRVGCRPSEAAALNWSNIAPEYSSIAIDSAWIASVGSLQGTKTHTERIIACGPDLQKLLRRIRRGKSQCSDYLFFSRQGRRIFRLNPNNFQRRYWQPIVQKLFAEGEISCYLPQKNCRHTRGTDLMRGGENVTDVSALLGNRPETFLKHYAEQARILQMPDLD
jgi:integrase